MQIGRCCEIAATAKKILEILTRSAQYLADFPLVNTKKGNEHLVNESFCVIDEIHLGGSIAKTRCKAGKDVRQDRR